MLSNNMPPFIAEQLEKNKMDKLNEENKRFENNEAINQNNDISTNNDMNGNDIGIVVIKFNNYQRFVSIFLLVIIIAICIYILYQNYYTCNISGIWLCKDGKNNILIKINQNIYLNKINLHHYINNKLIEIHKGKIKDKILTLCNGNIGKIDKGIIIWFDGSKWIKIN